MAKKFFLEKNFKKLFVRKLFLPIFSIFFEFWSSFWCGIIIFELFSACFKSFLSIFDEISGEIGGFGSFCKIYAKFFGATGAEKSQGVTQDFASKSRGGHVDLTPPLRRYPPSVQLWSRGVIWREIYTISTTFTSWFIALRNLEALGSRRLGNNLLKALQKTINFKASGLLQALHEMTNWFDNLWIGVKIRSTWN